MKTSDISVGYIQHCGSDLTVVNAARVSFNKESAWEYDVWIDPPGGETVESAEAKGWPVRHVAENPHLSDKDVKLINYLAKHKHLSPFNHCFITVRVKAPIFVARQLVKHEYMPWNEISRRYVDSEPEFYIPKVWRAKAEDKKQGSSSEEVRTGFWRDSDNHYSVSERVEEFLKQSLELYEDLTKAGVCPEQSRLVLPHNLMTEWYWSGTLGAFAKMLSLRLDAHTQKETRDVAVLVRDIIKPLFPVSIEALLESYKEKNE